MKPQYPIYVISKGRAETCLTANFLIEDKVDFFLVVEPQEEAAYRAKYPNANILVTPFSNLGQGSIPVRNFSWEHSASLGYARHWILDDNIYRVRRWYKKNRIPCDSGIAFKVCEDFVERYENIAIAGMNYTMFGVRSGNSIPPFRLNCHVYSCLLIDNKLPVRWRGRYNEDTDLCLQVLSLGLCTVQFNAFLIDKAATMTMKGGNMEQLYKGDGRLKMARSLERKWPYVVSTTRKFKRPQHSIKNAWAYFDTQLKLKPGVDLSTLAKTNEYGMSLNHKE